MISTHSPILMAYPKACIYLLDQNGVREVSYEDTEHYRVTRSFLLNHSRMLDEILGDAAEE